jgi:hypothetical protein
MAIFHQDLPASLRFGPPGTPGNPGNPGNRSVPATDRRPYLVTQPRKNPVPARQPVVSSRQFLALFPHEAEDARLTGATRSLYRRLLALNLPRTVAGVETASEIRETIETRFKHIDSRIA